MHVYGTYTYAGSYMHPVHCKQEMLLNLRVCGDSQNLIGQEILRSSYCTNKKKPLSSPKLKLYLASSEFQYFITSGQKCIYTILMRTRLVDRDACQ